MILVDTSVLVDYLKGRSTSATEKFQRILDFNIPFGINSFIYQELLQGATSEKEYDQLKQYLDTQFFYDLKDPRISFSDAAWLYLQCRRAGYTIRSTIDCLIAQTAIEHELFLLHSDQDYDHIHRVHKKLKIY
jgi:hypothetical protein